MIIHTPYVHGGDIYRNRVTLDFSVNVNPLGTPEAVRTAVRQAAGIAALDCPEWLEKARQLITREKNYLYRELRGLGICVLPGDANYLLRYGRTKRTKR